MKAIFKNRKEAGEKLALKLAEYKDKNAIVLGIPKGGVEVAFYVAKHLNAALSVVLSMKLPFTGDEHGFGALCEDDIYLAHVPPALTSELLTELINIKKMEIEKEIKKFRNNKPLPVLEKRTVILVSDGISNGVTLVPLIRMSKKKKAALTIVAAPLSCKKHDRGLCEADKIIVLQRLADFSSVNECYEDFTEPTDEKIISFLKEKTTKNENIR